MCKELFFLGGRRGCNLAKRANLAQLGGAGRSSTGGTRSPLYVCMSRWDEGLLLGKELKLMSSGMVVCTWKWLANARGGN